MGNRRRSMLFESPMIEIIQKIVIKSSGTYTIPVGTVRLDAFIVGAGGGGGLPVASTSYGSYTAGYAGEGGTVVYQENMPFIKGEEINVVIGEGGVAATAANNAGNKGGDTSFGNLIALGGNGGTAGTNSSPSIGSDGTACPFGDIESESITSTDLFGANGGDGSTTTTANVGGNTGAGKGANRSTAADNASFYGSAGGGGTIYRTFSTTIRKAGNGYQGVVILKVIRKMKESEIPLVEKFEIIEDTSRTSWTVPDNTKKIDIFIVGGGGGGDGSNSVNTNGDWVSGGGGGEVLYVEDISFTKNQIFELSVGDWTALSYGDEKGNPTTFGEYTVAGGEAGKESNGGYPYTKDGTLCPFGDLSHIDPELTATTKYAATGGYVRYSNGELQGYSGNKTGGGDGSIKGNAGNGTFYGSGGGGMGVSSGQVSRPGRGCQGIIIIRYYVRGFE